MSQLSNLASRSKSWSTSSRVELAKSCIQAVESDAWSTAGNWLKHSADVEKVPANERLKYGSQLRFVMGTTVKSFLEAYIRSCTPNGTVDVTKPTSLGPGAPGTTFQVIAETDTPAASAAAAEECLRAAPGTVTVVLGVGNQPFLTLVDTLQRVFYYGETVLIKQHPLRCYLEHPYRVLLAPLIEDNVVHMVQDEGIPATVAILKDPRVGHVHMTGAEKTAHAIERTLAENPSSPALTSELGCSTPWILTPAVYTEAELKKAALAAVVQKKLNGGSNCLDLQVLVIGSDWDQKKEFLEEVKIQCMATDTPVCYYPGVAKTYKDMKSHYEQKGKALLSGTTDNDVTIVDCGVYGSHDFDNYATVNEAFCPILAWVEVEGGLPAMVDFCNSEEVCGSLSCALLSPKSADAEQVEAALARLQYGTVAHNISQLLGYTTLGLGGMWGAYPGESRSGVGVVGNLYGVKVRNSMDIKRLTSH